MSQISPLAPASAASPTSEDLRLRRASQELEGVFVQELFKAMRETVPEGGLVDGGLGEEIFSGMMDQTISAEAASGWDRGVGAALYRQLRQRLSATETTTPPDMPVQGGK